MKGIKEKGEVINEYLKRRNEKGNKKKKIIT